MRSRTERAPRRRHERLTVRAGDALLGVAALGGVAVLAWTVLSAVLGLQLVAFATGSMAPTYPVGSLAVARTVPLADVHAGDVVTVQRGHGQLPITHRVFSIERSASGAELVLKGDANRYQDPVPYRVRSVRVVLLSLAWLSAPIRLATAPLGVGLGAAVVTGAVVWATWPVRRGRGVAPA